MKMNFEKKVVIGFVFSILIVGVLGLIYFFRTRGDLDLINKNRLDFLAYGLVGFVLVLLIVIFLVFRLQIRTKRISDQLSFSKEELFQSFLDNSPNPISIKENNGEYLIANKKYKSIFPATMNNHQGDLLQTDPASGISESDFEVVRRKKETKLEETIFIQGQPHTFYTVKFPLLDKEGENYAVGAILTDISDRKSIENALKKVDKFFDLSLDILVITNETNFIKINPTLPKVLGYTEQELLSNIFLTYVHPDDIEKTKKELAKLKTDSQTINFENRWVRKDGSVIWLNWYTSIDPDTNLLYSAAHDITERILAEKHLKEVNSFLSTVLNNIPYMIYVKEAKELRFLELNNAGEKLLGLKEQEWIGKNDFDFFPKEQADFFTNQDRKVLQNKIHLDIPEDLIETMNEKRWLHTQKIPVLDESGEALYLIGLSEDITERKTIESAFYKAYMFFNFANEIFVIENGDNFVKFNPAFTKILGYHESDAENIKPMNLIHPDDLESTKKEMAKLIAGEPMIIFEERVLCLDGTYKWIEWSATAEKLSGEIYMIGRDIALLVENEKSIQIAEKFFNMAFEMLIVGTENYFIKINPAVTATLGYTQTDIDKIKFLDLTHPEDLQKAQNQIKNLLAGEPLVNYKSRFRCKDKSYKWIDWSITADLKLGMIYAVARDISQQIKLEEEQQETLNLLNENEEKLKLIIDNIGDGVIVANPDKKVLLANYMAYEIFEIEENEELSINFSDHFELYFPDKKLVFPVQNLPMAKALNGETTEDIDLVLWDPIKQIKKRILVSGKPLIDQNNKVVAAVVTIKDISKYKQLEEELKESESKYHQLIGFKKNE